MHLNFWITFLRNVLKDRNMLFYSLAGNKFSLFEGTCDFFFNSLTRNFFILTSCTVYNVWSELLFLLHVIVNLVWLQVSSLKYQLTIRVSRIIMLYTGTLHSAVCPLFFTYMLVRLLTSWTTCYISLFFFSSSCVEI